MKVKHTSGQWTATKENKNFLIMSGRVYIGSVSSSDMIMSEAEANAKLIANAPDILKALKTCESITDRCNNAMLPQHVQELLTSLNDTMKKAIKQATN